MGEFAWELNVVEVGASDEGVMGDLGQRIRHSDKLQTRAVAEGEGAERGEVRRQDQGVQCAAAECHIGNGSDAVA